MFWQKKKKADEKIGGFAFFLSLFFLLFLAIFNLTLLPSLWDSYAFSNILRFSAAFLVGGWAAHYLIRGRTSVFIHELKHSIVSNLAGNKAKGMKIAERSGHFEYQYTKATEEYNAFIALAPYFFPLFTLPALGISLIFWYHNHAALVFAAGVGYGLDSLLNIRDIGPHQTDFTVIKGGFRVGLLYVVAMNTTLFTILMAWVMQEVFGLKFLLYGLWEVCFHLVAYYKGLT
ncbi:MAG: hypothetical protein D6719_05325 [Candidatus Dadabacteria bacterium]|nr:MAG: hypothetical protein D6719_05325 [Candidatus Dadabacteria bacterium]